MSTNPEKHVVTVGRYELTAPLDEYVAAARALAQRRFRDAEPFSWLEELAERGCGLLLRAHAALAVVER